MILLKDASILQGVPRVVADTPQAKAFAYAFSRQMAQLLALLPATRTYTAVDSVPEPVLDILAVELHVQEYSQSFPLARKRALVKGALSYWAQAGTAASVADVLNATFGGSAELQAWYEYGSSPGYFRINTDNPTLTGQMLTSFSRMANAVKRLSAWLESVNVNLTLPPAAAYQAATLGRNAAIALRSGRVSFTPPRLAASLPVGSVIQRTGAIHLTTQSI